MVLETERLRLRKPMLIDFDRFWELLNDPVAKRYTGGVTRMGYAERRALFERDAAEAFSERGAEFAVVDRQSGRYLGYCGFRYDERQGGPEFLYGYCRDCWGQGYGTEAAGAVLAYLFETFDYDGYDALAFAENAASIRILQKLGFTFCGETHDEDGAVVRRFRLTRASWRARLPGA